NTADSVSATVSTSVDLPTPPFVFITATVLRMPRGDPSVSPRSGRGRTPLPGSHGAFEVVCRANVADSRWRFQGPRLLRHSARVRRLRALGCSAGRAPADGC